MKLSQQRRQCCRTSRTCQRCSAKGSTASNSKALPLIWENWDDFRARFDEDAKHAAEAVAAAKANDATRLWSRAPGHRPKLAAAATRCIAADPG